MSWKQNPYYKKIMRLVKQLTLTTANSKGILMTKKNENIQQ